MPPTHPQPLPRAATLILVRQHAGALQTYLLRRSPASGFMPGLFVFPGGLVDAADCDEGFWRDHQDLAPQAVIKQLGKGLGFADALSFAVAAVRETFEEAGVFFASKAGASDADLKRAGKRCLEQSRRHGWFRTLVETEGWTPRLSALTPWSHWITPVGMPRRFDTRFFVAVLPEGQDGRPDLREMTDGLWISPQQALAGNMAGHTPLSPPTLVTLHELLGHPTLSAFEQERRGRGWCEPIFPRLVPLGKGRGPMILEPWDPMYGREDLRIDAGKLPGSVLPPGAPFSRLWNDGGIWKPVKYAERRRAGDRPPRRRPQACAGVTPQRR
jgi:8-oxo-dGTP pyrophosphatase MutT (NUDIX family)